MGQIITNTFFDDCEAIVQRYGLPTMHITYETVKHAVDTLGGSTATWGEVAKAFGLSESIARDPFQLLPVRVFLTAGTDPIDTYVSRSNTINGAMQVWPSTKGGSTVGYDLNIGILIPTSFDIGVQLIPLFVISDPYKTDDGLELIEKSCNFDALASQFPTE